MKTLPDDPSSQPGAKFRGWGWGWSSGVPWDGRAGARCHSFHQLGRPQGFSGCTRSRAEPGARTAALCLLLLTRPGARQPPGGRASQHLLGVELPRAQHEARACAPGGPERLTQGPEGTLSRVGSPPHRAPGSSPVKRGDRVAGRERRVEGTKAPSQPRGPACGAPSGTALPAARPAPAHSHSGLPGLLWSHRKQTGVKKAINRRA